MAILALDQPIVHSLSNGIFIELMYSQSFVLRSVSRLRQTSAPRLALDSILDSGQDLRTSVDMLVRLTVRLEKPITGKQRGATEHISINYAV